MISFVSPGYWQGPGLTIPALGVAIRGRQAAPLYLSTSYYECYRTVFIWKNTMSASNAQLVLNLLRTQRVLSMGVHNLDPQELLDRPTWRQAARLLTERWFPRSSGRQLAITELIEQSFLHALFWYPILQQRCPGTFRPTWFHGTLLSWFRRAASPSTQQHFYVPLHMDNTINVARMAENALALSGVKDGPWVEKSLAFLLDLAGTGGRKSEVARTIVESIAFITTDAQLQDGFDWRAPAVRRRVLRIRKIGTASYLRVGRDIHILCDQHAAARMDSDWEVLDLREESFEYLDYKFELETRDKNRLGQLRISLRDDVLADARATLKTIVSGKASVQQRVTQLSRFLTRFEAQHRYAPNAWSQFRDLSRQAHALAKRHLKAQMPRGSTISIPRIKTTNTLIIPKPNPFLDAMTVEDWERVFSPYRLA